MPEKKATTAVAKSAAAPATARAKVGASTKAAAPKAAAPKAAKVVAKVPAGRTATATPKPAAAKRVVRKRVAVLSTPAITRPAHAWRKGPRKTKIGVVVSAKQALTVIVQVERLREHPLYKKVIRVRKRFAAHDAAGDVRAGDIVRIEEGRPYSATKRWRVVEVLSRAGEAGAAAPKVGEIEAALEASEGSKEALVHVAASPVAKTEAADHE